jgi:phage terminase small subunit
MTVLANARHERFAQELAKGASQTDAYVAAGYKDDRGAASRLSAKVSIQERLAEILGKAAERVEITQAMVLAELGKIGFSDIRKLFTSGGALKRVEDLDDDAAACLSSIEVVTRKVPGGEDAEVEYTAKVKLWDKRAALVDIGKHLGMFKEAQAEPPQVNVVIGDSDLARLIVFQLTKASKES